MNPDQDPVIARALADLPVPDHGDGFWEGLDRRLDTLATGTAGDLDLRDRPGESAEPLATLPGVTGAGDADALDVRTTTGGLPSIGELYVTETPPRRPRIWFAAAAALLILAVAGAAILLAGGDDDPEVATPADESIETTSEQTSSSDDPTTTDPPTTRSTAPPTVVAVAPGPLVASWLEAVAFGDVETAAAMTGPRSIAYVESLGEDASIEGLIQESAEGYGGIAAAPDLAFEEVSLGSFSFGEAFLVVVSGTSTGEGEDGPVTVVLPVVTTDGESVVEPWALGPDDGRLEVTQPDNGALDAEQAIELFAPVDGTVFFRLDDGAEGVRPVETATVAGAPFARYDPPGPLADGDHVVVLGFASPDGNVLLAEAVKFTVG